MALVAEIDDDIREIPVSKITGDRQFDNGLNFVPSVTHSLTRMILINRNLDKKKKGRKKECNNNSSNSHVTLARMAKREEHLMSEDE